MAREIELFDGTVLEFPDNTPDEVLDRVARQETADRAQLASQGAPAPSGAPAQPTAAGLDPTSWWDYVPGVSQARDVMDYAAAGGGWTMPESVTERHADQQAGTEAAALLATTAIPAARAAKVAGPALWRGAKAVGRFVGETALGNAISGDGGGPIADYLIGRTVGRSVGGALIKRISRRLTRAERAARFGD